MNIKTLFLILFAQIKTKLSRFILASCSIMIGIWAILLTTSMSLSISKSFIDTINKDPLGRLTQVYVVTGDAIQYIDLDDVKKDFAPIQDIIKDITPSRLLYNYSFYINDPKKQLAVYSDEVSFVEFYDQNKDKWLGKKDTFEKNEIAICYYCYQLGSGLGFANPQEMLNKKIKLTFDDTMSYSPLVTQKKDGSTGSIQFTKKDVVKEFIVAAVIDDVTNTGAEERFRTYLPYSNYADVLKELATDKDFINISYTYYDLILKDYRDEQIVSGYVNKLGKYTFKPVSEDNKGIVQTIFKLIATIFSGFGIISLLTAIFGIFNSVTTSVLERKKEIGIYKSLGSSGFDIFKIFLVESIFLGILGWIFGFILALSTGHALEYYLKANAASYTGPTLSGATLELFEFGIPLWLMFASLGLSIVVTIVSSIIPAIRASKQDPADILRAD